MFYRRKILLALLRLLGGEAEVMRLQTVLLLFSKQQAQAAFEFIPDREGAFSLTAQADLSVMARKEMVRMTGTRLLLTDDKEYLRELKTDDEEPMRGLVKEYGSLPLDELLRRAYLLHPYYAARSEHAARLLSADEVKEVCSQLAPSTQTVLFTIGYEGIALEEYLNRLIRNDVRALIDIRNHPVSMKYGFSRATLRGFCERIGVDYIHMPEVGIKPEDRQDLHTAGDYHHLFQLYRNDYLPRLAPAVERLFALLKERERIVLACVEDDLNRCHRKLLAEALTRIPEFVYEVRHL